MIPACPQAIPETYIEDLIETPGKPRNPLANMLHRHPRLWLALLLLLLLGVAIMYALTATSVVEQIRGPADPVTVYLVERGHTSSLAMPLNGGGGHVRYAYGDWEWYALGNTTLPRGAAALLWPTQAGLGREIHRSHSGQSMKAVLSQDSDWVYALAASRSDVERVRQRLERLFMANHRSLVSKPGSRMEFVHHPRSYTLLWNSNRFTVELLREMNFTVHGQNFISRWKVEPPPPGP